MRGCRQRSMNARRHLLVIFERIHQPSVPSADVHRPVRSHVDVRNALVPQAGYDDNVPVRRSCSHRGCHRASSKAQKIVAEDDARDDTPPAFFVDAHADNLVVHRWHICERQRRAHALECCIRVRVEVVVVPGDSRRRHSEKHDSLSVEAEAEVGDDGCAWRFRQFEWRPHRLVEVVPPIFWHAACFVVVVVVVIQVEVLEPVIFLWCDVHVHVNVVVVVVVAGRCGWLRCGLFFCRRFVDVVCRERVENK
mmetsp:Transcript_10796/g.24379  ORF Transcript_10796/g.24379 Transcript_10796/m.24379 type:complete len:251 (+) Transcript_10796:785-1537(+)